MFFCERLALRIDGMLNSSSNHSRRDVLRFAGVAAGRWHWGRSRGRMSRCGRFRLGWNCIPFAQLPKDFTGVIEAIGKMGYAGVEFAGYCRWDRKPHELRKLLDDNGLKCCGTHTALNTLEGDELQKTIELHQILGNKFLICPNIPGDSAAAWMENAKKFNEISARQRVGPAGWISFTRAGFQTIRRQDSVGNLLRQYQPGCRPSDRYRQHA